MHDVAVVGRGLIGSAAARHLAESGRSTVVIGPGEPADHATDPGPFSSHYDEGRITRIASPSEIWAELGARSIARYADIETRSGIMFHDARGLIAATPDAATEVAHSRARGGDAELVDADWVRERTGIVLPDPTMAVTWERAPAGVINPRRLITAQTQLAAQAGATVVDAAAETIRPVTWDGSAGFELGGSWGTVRARRVLMATGAYGTSLADTSLAGAAPELSVERRLRTIVLAEMGHRPELPTLIVDDPLHAELDEIYWVPPVPFPDGRVCLKIGGDSLPKQTGSVDDIRGWFAAGGDEREAAALRATVNDLLPSVPVHSWHHKPCVVTYTDTDVPYIGWVDTGVAVAVGGSGSAAKSSDELGRLAAALVGSGTWDPADSSPEAILHPDRFSPLFA